MQNEQILSFVEITKVNTFIEENSDLIYHFINDEVLQGIGTINYEYFMLIIKNICTKKIDIGISEYNKFINMLPYYILTIVEKSGKIDYTSLRVETINFNQINEEAGVYYNYAQFSLDEEFLYIKLMQTKIGGMPIDQDIVKFTKEISIKNSGLEEYISQNTSQK